MYETKNSISGSVDELYQQVDWTHVRYFSDPSRDLIQYSVPFRVSRAGTIKNLIVFGDLAYPQVQIIEFIPKGGWLDLYNLNDHMHLFTGEIHWMTTDGILFAQARLKDGKDINYQRSSTVCETTILEFPHTRDCPGVDPGVICSEFYVEYVEVEVCSNTGSGPDSGGSEGGSSSGGGGGGGGGPAPVILPIYLEIDPLESLELYDLEDGCVKDQILAATDKMVDNIIMNDLKGALGIIDDGFGIYIAKDAFLNDSIEAVASPISEYTVGIYLNDDLFSASKEFITATLYHEYIHAILHFHWMKREFHDPNYEHELLTQLDELLAQGKNKNDAHHIMMWANGYKDKLAAAIQSMHSNISSADANVLAFGGLGRTYNSTEDAQTNKDYKEGSKGDKCN